MNKNEFLGASLHTGLKLHLHGLYNIDHTNNGKVTPITVELIGMGLTEVEIYEIGRVITERYEICDCFIIARPISDLIKPITHNGETFVPILKLASYPDELENTGLGYEHKKYYASFGYKDDFIRYEVFANVNDMNFYQVQKLIEWHFNLMNESEPFIPVTNEFNPYK